MTKPFVHLHVHSHYSLLDGAAKVPDLVNLACKYEMPALALTDHGNLFGALEFYEYARKSGIKPIVGYEAYIAPNSMKDKDKTRYHLTLLAKNYEGYYNLMQLASEAYLTGFYYKPRIDKELLAKYSKGIIALSGCLASEVCRHIVHDDMNKARETVAFYRDLFKDDFYLEVQRNHLEEQEKANAGLVQLHNEFNIPLVFTNDIHYLQKEDAEAHEVLLCIQTGTTLNNPERFRFKTQEYYMKTSEQMYEESKDLPNAAANTVEVAEKVNLEIVIGKNHLPYFECPDHKTNEEYLHELCIKGLKERYKEITPALQERFDMEFKVICNMGFAAYFLIVSDFINYARSQGISVGPGRGSAAGSIVSYALYITNLDPIKYHLIFERFLNEGRHEMPDIDIDFETIRRSEVIDYVTRKYGERQVSQIITFGTMAARGVLRDVGRVKEIPLAEVDKIAKKVPMELNMTLQKALETSPEFKEIYDNDPQARDLIDVSRKLEGLNRQPGTHAAGVIIADKDLTEYCPLYRTVENIISTQYSKEHMEHLGLLKMDFLGLSTLTVIENNLKMIEEVRGEKLDLNSIPLDDEETYEMLRKGKTKGVFQLESDGMTELVKKLLPDRFEDLIALVALFRPGPLGCGMVDQYCDCKHGRAEPDYLHPCLKDILEDTYGVILYQEQVMRIASELSGFTLSEADRLRKAMGKKKLEIMQEYRSKFVLGAEEKHNVPKEQAEHIFDLIEYFSGYGFNKSHSAAYGLVSYQTAYLKAHYPKEFMAALMTNESQDSDKIVKYIHECESMGIKVLPPDINESKGSFRPNKEGIRFGLAALKGVGEKAITPLEEAKEKLGKITSLFQLCKNIDVRLVNKQVLESLTKSGAFDCWNRPRRQIFESIPEALKLANSIQKEKSSNQMSLFDFGDDEEEQEDTSLEKYIGVPEWSENEKLKFEKETIGFFMSSHPLQHLHYITQKIATPIKELDPRDKSLKIIACIIVQSHVTQIKQGKSQGHKMAQLVVEDRTGNCKVTCFSSAYEANPDLYQEDKMIFIQGKQDIKQDDEIKLIVDKAYSLEEGLKLHTAIVNFDLGTQFSNEEDLLKLKNILIKYPGNCPIALRLNINSQEIQLQPAPEYNINLSPDFFKEIEQSFDDSVITLVKRELEQRNTQYKKYGEFSKK